LRKDYGTYTGETCLHDEVGQKAKSEEASKRDQATIQKRKEEIGVGLCELQLLGFMKTVERKKVDKTSPEGEGVVPPVSQSAGGATGRR